MSNLKFDDLPKEIQDKMLDHQEAQGNKRDPEVFRKDLYMEADTGGFNWSRTPEGLKFWSSILDHGNLQTFYDRYPSPDPLWDQMAVQAMAAFISTTALNLSGQEARRGLAALCYKMADSMMEEREKRLRTKSEIK